MAIITRQDIIEEGGTYAQIAAMFVEYDKLVKGSDGHYLNIPCNPIIKDNSICAYCGSNKTRLERCDSCGANIDK